ncbi:ABC transporter permease [Bifidobacterium aemilianum]|uniref:ABC transporter permease n=1 Tax=Bifidobacterium aemilianum TaxID=2493120 RepID=A0A366K9J4_9BIFI|nr:amino acid ABC transporter permease [Bifidobacterium aemilianum]RBP98396.1 ABC transporter permease [Bifidobacterium aemilianum]
MSEFIKLFSEYNIPGAFLVNIELTLWAALFSLILGVILVIMRISPVSSLRTVAAGYVEFFQNMPLTIIMVFMVLGVFAQLKLSFSDEFAVNFFWLAVVGLSLYTAAFVCESLRSGINTVPLGQAEAARALGLSFIQSAGGIILPQAFRGSVAPLGNTFIALLKNSTVAAAASVTTESSTLMSEMIEFHANSIVAIFLIFAMGYVILVLPIGALTTYLSNKLAVRR